MGNVLAPWMRRIAPFLESAKNGQLACGFVRLFGDNDFDGHVALIAGL
jgi:hypothetical protein